MLGAACSRRAHLISDNGRVKAVRLYAPRSLRIDELAEPELGEDQVVVRVATVGICGSDVHYYCDGFIGETVARDPLVLGHEFAGTIQAVGDRVRGLSPGQLVAVDPAIPCGTCESCLQGSPNICPSVRFAGTPPIDGGLRQLLAWPAAQIVPVPSTMTPTVAALLEPLGVALHAVNLAHIRLADRVAVLGVGPIGLLIVCLARLSGAVQVFATDKHRVRLDLARRLGATHVIDVQADEPVRRILDFTKGRGVDVAFEAAGVPETPMQGVDVLRPGGSLVVVGIFPEDRIPLTSSAPRRKGITIKLVRRMKHVYPRAIALVEHGQVDLESLVSHRYPLDAAPAAFEHLTGERSDAVKIMVDA
jgi:L-iditol 2-dehydrogenase